MEKKRRGYLAIEISLKKISSENLPAFMDKMHSDLDSLMIFCPGFPNDEDNVRFIKDLSRSISIFTKEIPESTYFILKNNRR